MAEWLDEAERWLIAHNTDTDLTAVWILTVCFAVMGVVNLLSWWALRQTYDRTNVGRALKGKKAAEGVANLCMAGLYGLTLWAWYQQYAFGPWPRIAVRTVLAVGLIVAGIHGIRFVVALRSEMRRDTARGDPAKEV